MKSWRLVKYLMRYWRVKVGGEYAERVLNAMLVRGVAHSRASRNSDGELCFCVSRQDVKMLAEIVDKCAISVYSVYGVGLPFILRRYRGRAGMFAGAVLFALIVFTSSLFVWDIDVVAADGLDPSVIERNLNALGCSPGTFAKGTDFNELCNDYLATYDDCSWISVNVVGTVAFVEARARVGVNAESDDDAPCNIIARYGGVVVSRAVYEGSPHAVAGDVVEEGGLLISGIVEDAQGSMRLCRARGEVLAEIERVFTVTVDYEQQTRRFSGKETISRSFMFFGLEIPLPGGSEPEGEYETVIDTGVFHVDEKELPAALKTVSARRFETQTQRLTPERAQAIAEYRMTGICESGTKGAQVLEIAKETIHSDTACTVEWRVRMITDIAERAPIHTK